MKLCMNIKLIKKNKIAKRLMRLPKLGPLIVSSFFFFIFLSILFFSVGYLIFWRTRISFDFLLLFFCSCFLLYVYLALFSQIYSHYQLKIAGLQVTLIFSLVFGLVIGSFSLKLSFILIMLIGLVGTVFLFFLACINRFSRMLDLWPKNIILGSSCFIVFLLYFPLFSVWTHYSLIIINSGNRWQLETNRVYQINSDGYRGKIVNKNEKEHDPRLLFLGDSSTFGFGGKSEDCFSALIENSLRNNGFPGTRSINAGVVGAPLSVLHERYKAYKHLGPDLVFIMAGMHSDVLAKIPPMEKRLPGVFFLVDIVRYIIKYNQAKAGIHLPWIEQLSNLIDDIVDDGFTPILLIYPCPQLDHKLILAQKELAARKQIQIIDVRNNLLPRIDQYLIDSIHPNRAGHQQIAQSIVNWIETRGLFKGNQTTTIILKNKVEIN